METRRIEPEDEVIVYFGHHEPIRGVVIYTPSATGDVWTIERGDGKLVAVQQFDYMERV